jgi:hypothetical protein
MALARAPGKDGRLSTEDGVGLLAEEARAKALNKRLDTIAWACFLIMIGCLGLVPKEQFPEGTWLVGVGIIWLGLNVARYLNDIKMSGGTIVLGIVAIGAGAGDIYGLDLPVLPILLVLLGTHLLLKHFFEDKVE